MDASKTLHDDGALFVIPKTTLSMAFQTAEAGKIRKIQLQPLESQTSKRGRQSSVAKSILLVLTVTLAMVVNVGSTVNFPTSYNMCSFSFKNGLSRQPIRLRSQWLFQPSKGRCMFKKKNCSGLSLPIRSVLLVVLLIFDYSRACPAPPGRKTDLSANVTNAIILPGLFATRMWQACRRIRQEKNVFDWFNHPYCFHTWMFICKRFASLYKLHDRGS